MPAAVRRAIADGDPASLSVSQALPVQRQPEGQRLEDAQLGEDRQVVARPALRPRHAVGAPRSPSSRSRTRALPRTSGRVAAHRIERDAALCRQDELGGRERVVGDAQLIAPRSFARCRHRRCQSGTWLSGDCLDSRYGRWPSPPSATSASTPSANGLPGPVFRRSACVGGRQSRERRHRRARRPGLVTRARDPPRLPFPLPDVGLIEQGDRFVATGAQANRCQPRRVPEWSAGPRDWHRSGCDDPTQG